MGDSDRSTEARSRTSGDRSIRRGSPPQGLASAVPSEAVDGRLGLVNACYREHIAAGVFMVLPFQITNKEC